MSDNSVRGAMARGFATLLTGRAAVLGLQFVTLGVLAAHLEPAGLGVYTFGLAAAGLFRLLPNFGLVPVLSRDVAQRPELEPSLVPNVIYIRTLLGISSYGLLALGVLLVDFGDANTRAALVAGLVVLIVFDVFRSTLEVRLRLGWISLADLVEATATLGGSIALARSGAGPESFLWLYVVLKVVNAVILGLAARRMVRYRWSLRRELWRPVIGAALPLGVAGVFMALYYRLDILILAWLKEPGDVGQYGVAYRFLDAFSVLPALAMTVLSPVLSRSVVEGAQSLGRRYREAAHLVSVAAMFVALVGGATAWRILPELPGFGRFDGGGIALSILSPAAGLILVGTVVQGTLISSHLQGRLLRISAAGLAVNLALNLALIPPFSYVGAAIATTLTEVVLIGLSLREIRRNLALGWDGRRLLSLGLATLLTAAVLGVGFLFSPWLQLALGTLCYVGALPLLGVLGVDELRGVLRLGRAAGESDDPPRDNPA